MNKPLFDKSLDESLSGKSDVPTEWLARVHSELRRGERLIWVGQPRPAYFARQVFGGFIFGIVWTLLCVWFAVFFYWLDGGHGQKNEPLPVAVCLGPFFLIGLGLMSLPYWGWRKAKRTCYALTDRRAILWEAGAFGSVEVRFYEPEDLTELYRVEYPGGGDLVFEEAYTIRQNSEGEQTTVTKQRGFLGIENVHEVEGFLRRTLLKIDD